MNKHKILELYYKLKSRPDLMKKFKVFALVATVSFLLIGSLAIWAGISAIKYVASSTTQIIDSPSTKIHVEQLKTELNNLPNVQALNCWGKIQRLLAVQPWLERPVLVNLNNLKIACFEQTPVDCE